MKAFVVFIFSATLLSAPIAMYIWEYQMPNLHGFLQSPYLSHVVAAGFALIILGPFLWARWPPRPPGNGPEPLERIAPRPGRTLAVRIQHLHIAHALPLLVHMAGLPGLRVVSYKSGNDSDEPEAYFVFKNRLYALKTSMEFTPWRFGMPLSRDRLVISQNGDPPDEAAFAEVERHIGTYSRRQALRTLPAQMRVWLLPSSPRKFLLKHGIPQPASAIRHPAAGAPETVTGTDPLPVVEFFLSFGRRKEAIILLEQAAKENPANDAIRRRLLELRAGGK